MKIERAYSRYAQQAVRLLGTQIHAARITQGVTAAALAERAGVSRGVLHRIEAGDMGVSIGAAFELAAVLGLPLFEDTPARLGQDLKRSQTALTLLPRAARKAQRAVDDNF